LFSFKKAPSNNDIETSNCEEMMLYFTAFPVDIVSTIKQLILVFRYHQVAKFEKASWLINNKKWTEKKTLYFMR
jgi:hypothetical protein